MFGFKKLWEKRNLKPIRIPKDRIIRIHEQICDAIANDAIALLLFHQKQDPKRPVILDINSMGGGVAAALAIVDAMSFVGYPIVTVCEGNAFGCAAVIFARGKRGHRYAARDAQFGFTRTKGSDKLSSDESQHYLLQLDERIADELAHATGRARDEISADMELDRIFSAEEAIASGLADKLKDW